MNPIKRYLSLAIAGCCASFVTAGDTLKYCSPFDFPILLSANFGELRPNHFHNGLDFKTKGTVGHPIHCIADGYVSRVAVQHGGYGQAIYITHPDGHTSVYGHIISFAPEVEKYIREYQYANETFVCYLYPEPGRFSFKQGDIIAYSGNEGSSAGPHLHLEIRKTDTDEYLDPMPYFKQWIKDTKAPVASLVGFYPIKGEGVVDGKTRKKLLSVSSLGQPVTAWGKIYTGISARDYMDGTSNFYGVHSVTLYVDSVKVFSSKTERVLPDENRMVNAFTDYDEYIRSRRLIMRSYKAPANKLRMIWTGNGTGIIDITEERNYNFEYVLEDNFGNSRKYRFIVKGKRQDIPLCCDTDSTRSHSGTAGTSDTVEEPAGKGGAGNTYTGKEMLTAGRTTVIQRPGLELIVPKGYVYEDTPVSVNILDSDSSAVSLEYDIDAGNTPLHSYCPIAIGLRRIGDVSPEKYYVQQRVGKWKSSVGGEYDNGWMRARIRSFGAYSVAVDTVPPVVTPVDKSKWRSTSNIRFRVKDSASGINTYKVYIDGKFVLFGLKKGLLVIQDKNKVKKGVPHSLKVVVTDMCGNETVKNMNF